MDVIIQFREASRALEYHFKNLNKSDCCKCGINESHCFMIVEIGRRPGISVKELSTILGVDKSGISRAVEDLVQKDFVERKASTEDRRYVTLTLTDKGIQRFEQIESSMYEKFKKVFENIPTDKQSIVLESLKLYDEACRKAELT